MDFNNVKMLVCDIDGTLILPGNIDPSEKVINQINYLMDNNIKFAIASGRTYNSISTVFSGIKSDFYKICENGSLSVYKDEVIDKKILKKHLISDLATDIYSSPEHEIMISTERESYIMPKYDEFTEKLMLYTKTKFNIIENVEEVKEDILKMSCFFIEGLNKTTLDFFREKYEKDLTIAVGATNWIDFTSKGVSKGEALTKIMEIEKYSKNEVITFGDNENDISMLSITNSFAMSSATDYVKSFAKSECERVEDIFDQLIRSIEKRK